jgi:hypothetical protein
MPFATSLGMLISVGRPTIDRPFPNVGILTITMTYAGSLIDFPLLAMLLQEGEKGFAKFQEKDDLQAVFMSKFWALACWLTLRGRLCSRDNFITIPNHLLRTPRTGCSLYSCHESFRLEASVYA